MKGKKTTWSVKSSTVHLWPTGTRLGHALGLYPPIVPVPTPCPGFPMHFLWALALTTPFSQSCWLPPGAAEDPGLESRMQILPIFPVLQACLLPLAPVALFPRTVETSKPEWIAYY